MENMFMKFLVEAPGDEEETTPDNNMDASTDAPDNSTEMETPPDIDDTSSDTGDNLNDVNSDDAPPDLDDDLNDDIMSGDSDEDNTSDGEDNPPQELAGKVSAILNTNLYQKFLALLNNINNELISLRDNTDMFHVISPDSIDIIPKLKKLDENIRLYLKNIFVTENYGKNKLFFNKCSNLLNLLNMHFNKKISKGIANIGS